MIKANTIVVLTPLSVKRSWRTPSQLDQFHKHNNTLIKFWIVLNPQELFVSRNSVVVVVCHLFHWSAGKWLCFPAYTGTCCVIGNPRELDTDWVQFVLYLHFHDFYPRPVLAFGYCHRLHMCVCLSVRVCVCECVNHLLVRAITRDPFKLGSPNFGQMCKDLR